MSNDQRAMLQLLLERGQSYEDIGSLLGLEVDEVRTRARAALTEIAGEDPDREVGLTDYLLGQADPIGRADAARHLQSDSDARDLAERLTTQLRVLAPGATFPDLPGGRGRPERKAPEPAATDAPAAKSEATAPGAGEPAPSSRGGFASGLDPRQRTLIAALAGGGVLVVVIVLVVAGVFSGGDGSNGGNTTASNSNGSSNASGLTRAVLDAQNGSNASGVAVFARVRNTPVLQINVNGLKPTGKGQAYVIWLYGSNSQAFPLSREPLKGSNLRGAAPVPTQVVQALQQGLFSSVDVSLATDAEMTAALKAARSKQRLPKYAGESIVRGTITGPGFTGGGSGSGGSNQG